MAGFHFKCTWPDKCEVAVKDDAFTPQPSDIEGHVRCDLKATNIDLRVDFSWPEVATMLSVAFPVYLPTADAASRFIHSNPQTAASMLLEAFKLSTEASRSSNGRLREIWKLAGGMVDSKNRAWIEADLLPGLLRLLAEIPETAV